MAKPPKQTFLERVKAKAFNHPLIAAIVIGVTAIIGANQLVDASFNLAEKAGLRPGALALTQESAKGDFSRQLTATMYRRQFWTDAYLTRVQRSAPPEEVAAAWQQYIFSASDWTANLVNNEAQIVAYYGADRARKFMSDVHGGFLLVHSELMKVKYPATGAAPANLKVVEASVRAQNVRIYTFATGLQPSTGNSAPR